MSQVAESFLDPIRDAVAGGDWDRAYRLLSEADAERRLDAETLPMLADAAYVAGRPQVAIHAWERVHADALKSSDTLGAAGAAVRVSFLLVDAGLLVEARGWVGRIQRLLEGQPETPIHAALAVVEAWRNLWTGNMDACLEWARRAIDLGTRFDDQSAVGFARSAEARALIFQGHVEEGLALLDETTVAVFSGGLDPVTTGVLYCSVLCAFQALGEYERAEEWTAAMERWSGEHGFGSFHGKCRVHRAELLRARGAHAEAEEQARVACQEFRVFMRGELGWPLAELGHIRLRMGNLAGAEEAFLESYELGWDPQPGWALLRLAEGDIDAAAAQIRAALDEPRDHPSSERPPTTELRRAPLLAAQAEIGVAAGDLERARRAADELARIAETYGTTALRASAAVAGGMVELAEGNPASARSSLQRGVSLWGQVNAPYEAARARMRLAQAHRASGEREHLLLELKAARSTFERLGARLDAKRAAQAQEEAGVAPPATTEARTFMFTDIVRSTALVEVIGDDAWTDLVRWHDQTLRTLFANHHGEEIDHAGDGFFVAFEDPSVAVHCAKAIHRTLAKHRREHGFAPQVRIGLHLAEARKSGDAFRGRGVHEAARIAALAEGGEIVASMATLDAIGDQETDGEVRTVSLKGISQPVRVVSVGWHD